MKIIVLITNIPTPYRLPLFNEINGQLNEKGMELHVIFSESGYKRRKFEIDFTKVNFKYTILEGGKITSQKDSEKTYFFYFGLWKVLNAIKPAQIIVAGFSSASIITALWSQKNKTPFSIWSGSITTEQRNTSFIRRLIRKQLIQRAYSFIAYGNKAKDYLINNRAEPSKIQIGINTVDTTFYQEETKKLKSAFLESGIFTFIYLGYLVPRKNVNKVLEAVRLLKEKRSDFRLIIIGDGESKSELMEFSEKNQLNHQIEFTGYKQKQELPYFFAQADALLFQSNFDIWGLVLNEAMAAGICCLSTKNAGASFDLIQENINGMTIDYNQTQAVAEKMNWMIDHRKEVKLMGENASLFIKENANLSKSANGFILALKEK